MFTGLVEKTAKLIAISSSAGSASLTLENPFADDLMLGESIAVDGACLTLSKIVGKKLSFDLSAETLKKTNFVQYRAGRLLNLERALRLGDRLGGHLLSGHLDCLGKFIKEGDQDKWYFEYPKEYNDLLIEKGSVSINGISLTTIEVKEGNFAVAIIPETLKRTNLKSLRPGDVVHLEFDIIAKYLAKLAQKSIGQGQEKRNLNSLLLEKGFIN